VAKGRTPVVTIEPWPVTSIGTADSLLPDIVAGKYDLLIKALSPTELPVKKSAVITAGGDRQRCARN